MPLQSGPETIYLIGNPANSLVKIGRTRSSVNTRLSSLQAGSPVLLHILWAAICPEYTEARLHSRFGRLRQHGEWFDFGSNDPVAAVEEELQRRNIEFDPVKVTPIKRRRTTTYDPDAFPSYSGYWLHL